MKYYFIILMFFFSSIISAQEGNQQLKEDDIDKFVSILIKSKSIKINYDSILMRLLYDTGISQERYGQILRSKLEWSTILLTKAEENAMALIDEKDTEIKTVKNNIIFTLCKEKGLPLSKYTYIKEKMNSDLHLRDSIKTLISKSKD